jgi:hypothetical protein
MSVKSMVVKLTILVALIGTFVTVSGIYLPSNRDTLPAPDSVTYDISEPTDMELLYETDTIAYYFRESRDVIAVYDKRNNYTFYTGLDAPFSKDVEEACDVVVDDYEYESEHVDLSYFGFEFYSTALDVDNNMDLSNLDGRGISGQLGIWIDDVSNNPEGFAIVNQTFDASDYRISFEAESREGFDLTIYVYLQDGTVIDSGTVSITSEMASHSLDLTIPNEPVTILFDVSSSTRTIYFESISMVKIAGVFEVADSEQLPHVNLELLDADRTVKEADVLEVCEPIETRLNTLYTGFANSLVSVEYYDDANNIKRLSSATYDDPDDPTPVPSSMLYTVDNDPSKRRLDVNFPNIDLAFSVYITFTESGINYHIPDESITGEGQTVLGAIILSPFLGASGGANEVFDMNELDYADETFKYQIPGYTFIPDGSGALLRFNDNNVELNEYVGQIYGVDIADEYSYMNESEMYLPFKSLSMPVFGMAHGDDQAAFVAYAEEGDSYMQLVSMPEENLTYYNFTYPRFEYNTTYYQVYNQQGWGYSTLFEERRHFDVDITYTFLANEEANYVGMAHAYRDHLIEEGILTELSEAQDHIPVRIDFVMADDERAIAGYTSRVTTTTDDVRTILDDLLSRGVANINSGLLGWADGGITRANPSVTRFNGSVGSSSDVEALASYAQTIGIDISLQSNYFNVAQESINPNDNALKHASNWYSELNTQDYPVALYYYIRPTKSVLWMSDHVDDFTKLGLESITIDGVGSNLATDYQEDLNRMDVEAMLVEGLCALDIDLNIIQPNSYLYECVDRYLQAPVYNTQFLIQTDTVPFVQLVLQGTMELYGPYSNFSFYTDSDVLRMIDYNIYPSFVLTQQPSYLLADTNSRYFYSTEYTLYDELIPSIYSRVDEILRHVQTAKWESREVLEAGVILNTYDNGVEVLINYTEDVYEYNGVQIEPVSVEMVGDFNG